jgi:UDP-galactopyranose mutase
VYFKKFRDSKKMEMRYDYVIVGSGLFGAVFAQQMTENGKKCLVIEKRNHAGGNVYCENIEGINVHVYGPHIFHTNDKKIWDFVNRFVEFNNFVYSPIANYKGEIYNLPFNMNTFSKLWGISKPEDAKAIINEQAYSASKNVKNLEEKAISIIGIDVYEKLIKGYTKKQWGRDPKDLPSSIISRLPVRFTYDNNYFNDRYQGIPIGGYNVLIENLLKGIEVLLNCDFFENKEYYESIAEKVVYTGPIDRYFNYEFGNLEYRSLRFEHESHQVENYQGVAGMNYTDEETPYTRIVEHKHFEFVKSQSTVITKEYPVNYVRGIEPYYPINDSKNGDIYSKYFQKAKAIDNLIIGGRLAEYKYYDMHQVIGAALAKTKIILENEL